MDEEIADLNAQLRKSGDSSTNPAQPGTPASAPTCSPEQDVTSQQAQSESSATENQSQHESSGHDMTIGHGPTINFRGWTSAAVEFRIISRLRDPFDVVSKHNSNPRTDSHREAWYVLPRVLLKHPEQSLSHLKLGITISNQSCSLQSHEKSVIVHRLKEVVRRVNLKSAQRMLFVRTFSE
jgi:hypothetical protein